MITLIKHTWRGSSYSTMTLNDVAESIRTASLATESDMPELCFAAEWKKYRGELNAQAYNQLCLLQVQNLYSEDEMDEVFRLARAVPYTVLLFRGRDQRTVNIICRFTFDGAETDEVRIVRNMTPRIEEADYLCFMQNAYKMLHYAYSVQLHSTIDVRKPSMSETCHWAADEDVYYNPDAMPFFSSVDNVEVPAYEVPAEGRPNIVALPLKNAYQELSLRYNWAYSKALETARLRSKCQEEMIEACLKLLAENCNKEGLEMEYAIRHTIMKNAYWNREMHVRQVFANAYEQELHHAIPFGHIEKSALLVMRMEAYMKSRYKLRRNTLTGVVEYCHRGNYEDFFQTLTEKDLNTMTADALKMGLASWDKDLQRYVNSSKVEEFDPLAAYLQGLPEWDGKDYIADFIARIPSDTAHYDHYLRIWLRSMVAHWLGKDRMHGNALVPLLVGDQGCGKTSLCNMILPRCLQMYYNDKVDFRNEAGIMSALSNYALINIDEFDSLKRSQQPTLKYLLSKHNVRFRPPYGRAIVERRRYASFIGTTNLLHPLMDQTGSRRFACIRIRPGQQVDHKTAVPYDQLYAQILHEINAGERFWLDDAETAELQRQNAAFQRQPELPELLRKYFESPSLTDDTLTSCDYWHTLDDIIAHIRSLYPETEATPTFRQRVGQLLTEMGYQSRRLRNGRQYRVRIKCLV